MNEKNMKKIMELNGFSHFIYVMVGGVSHWDKAVFSLLNRVIFSFPLRFLETVALALLTLAPISGYVDINQYFSL